MRQVLETPEGRECQTDGAVKLVGTICEIDTGLVWFLERAATDARRSRSQTSSATDSR